MENDFDQFVVALSKSSFSTNVIYQLTTVIEQQTGKSLSLLISQSFQSLLILEQWVWQLLSEEDPVEWINQPYYQDLLHTLASFNKKLICDYDNIENDAKASLLFPESIDQLNGILKHFGQSQDDNDPFIIIVSLWFDNLSCFIYENPQFDALPVISYINEYIDRNYLMTDRFKFYLTQLQLPQISPSIFSAKQLFYIKTCSLSLNSYLSASVRKFPFTPEEMLHHVGHEYLQIIYIHNHTVEFWDKELLLCIADLTGFICSCCWWVGETSTQIKVFLSTEERICNFAQALIRILSYKPFYQEIQSKRSNSETTLMDVVLKLIFNLLRTQNMNWFFRSNLSLPDTLSIIAEKSTFDEISLCAYAILGEILTDEKLKELKVTDSITNFFKINIEFVEILSSYLLCFSSLTKGDAIQQTIANSQRTVPLLIEMCDEYPLVFDILWGLSFNQDIQQQLRSDTSFMSKLSHLAKECDNKRMRKITHGLLWNLAINHEDRSTLEYSSETLFDSMISYSHKDEELCKQIYEEPVKAGYRVWIDFDRMHGNVMDAMAQYRKSHYCRAEAHYVFQRQRKIVSVLLQKRYKPDGWLLFRIGQLMYVDFTKYEFCRAMGILHRELKGTYIANNNAVAVQPKQDMSDTDPKLYLPPILPKNLLDWSQTHVQGWLIGHNLLQMSHLFADCNGRSLLYLDHYMRSGDTNQILNLLQEDSIRKIGHTLSLTELSRFRSLIDDQKQIMKSNIPTGLTRLNKNPAEKLSLFWCRIM